MFYKRTIFDRASSLGTILVVLIGLALYTAVSCNSDKECEPDCEGKCCGDDGCGGTCANVCPDPCQSPYLFCDRISCLCLDWECNADCSGKCCGSDGCCDTCPNECPTGEQCNISTCECEALADIGEACPHNSGINSDAPDCEPVFDCIGEYELGDCSNVGECSSPASYHPDCYMGKCGYSFCSISCELEQCPAGFVENTFLGSCYCFPE